MRRRPSAHQPRWAAAIGPAQIRVASLHDEPRTALKTPTATSALGPPPSLLGGRSRARAAGSRRTLSRGARHSRWAGRSSLLISALSQSGLGALDVPKPVVEFA